MYKKNINEYALLDTDKDKFEDLYTVEDPWNLKGRQDQFRYRRTIEYILRNFQKPKLKVLELGCSEGGFSELLSKEGFRVTSVDISEKAIERAKKRNLENVRFICSDMIQYSVNNDLSSFDLILILECIYYLKKEKRIVLIEILHEKINPEAKILVSLPVNNDNEMFSPENRILKKFSNLGFGLYKNLQGIILSSKGKTGRLLEFIPSYSLKKVYLNLHKFLLKSRINQKLFLFRKD